MTMNKKGKERELVLTILVILIILGAFIACVLGIWSTQGPGQYAYDTIRDQTVTIHGKGVYQHMTYEVALQGIGHDVVTLFLGIPALLVFFLRARKGSCRARLLLAGILGYFHVQYLFYMIMGMYNILFLVYVLLAGCTFFALLQVLFSVDTDNLKNRMTSVPKKFIGGFLMVNAAAIALLWLQIVLIPLFDGTLYPLELAHYTTLIVQGVDLGLLLPLAVVCGWLLIKERPLGYLAAPVYCIFLTLHMIALIGKIVAMGLNGFSIIPVVFIMPMFAVLSGYCSVRALRSISG